MDNIRYSDEEMSGIIDEIETGSSIEPEPTIDSGSSIEPNQPEALLEEPKKNEELALDCKKADLIKTLNQCLSEIDRCENLSKLADLKKRFKDRITVDAPPQKPLMIGEDPDPLDPPFSITYHEIPIVSQGGLLVLTGAIGCMKSFVVMAILSSLETPGSDSLGFDIHLPDGKYGILLDTELNPQLILRRYRTFCLRAGIQPHQQRRVKIAKLQGLSKADKLLALDEHINSPDCGLIIMDCATDFCPDILDPTRSYDFVERLLNEGTNRGVTFIATIHDNPASSKAAVTGKARGHIGTYLLQKSEAAFLIIRDRTTGVVRITTDFEFGKSRNSKDYGNTSYLRWDDTKGYPVSMDEERYEQEFTSKQTAYVMNLFSGKETWTTKELKERIFEVEKISERTAVDRIKSYVDIGALVKIRTGVYSVSGTLLSENILGGNDE